MNKEGEALTEETTETILTEVTPVHKPRRTFSRYPHSGEENMARRRLKPEANISTLDSPLMRCGEENILGLDSLEVAEAVFLDWRRLRPSSWIGQRTHPPYKCSQVVRLAPVP
jgi:hypothetical protein